MERIVRVELIGRALIACVCAGVVALSALAANPLLTDAGRRIDIDAFMTGLACVESHGSFEALNASSRAYGKYQIMPRIWPAWAARYLNNRWARPTPRNQEYVARQRIIDLYELHGSWPLVAHWWLTGSADPDESTWSKGSRHYVDSVMETARAAASGGSAPETEVPSRCAPVDYPAPTIRTKPWPRVVLIGRVHMRIGPGYENRSTGTLARRTVVAVLAKRHDARGKLWLEVGLRDGSRAWIASWYTRPKTGR